MSPGEIARLDPWWVANVIFYPRDSKGEYLPMAPESPETERETVTEREAFGIIRRKLGLSEWRIEALWEELQGKRKSGS